MVWRHGLCHHSTRNMIHVGIMNLYRRFLGLRPDSHFSDIDVLVRIGLPDPTELLRRARLRYFGTLHQCRSHSHWGVLQEDSSWIQLLRDDLHWLWQQLRRSSDLKDPTTSFPHWQDIIVHHPGYWKKLIKRGIAHACLQRENEHQATELHARVGRILCESGLVDDIPRHTTTAQSLCAQSSFGCMQC